MEKTSPRLKNGLTPEQVEKAKEVLEQVNVSEICRELNIPRATINHVLNGTSKKVHQLLRVVQKAKTKIKKNQSGFEGL